MRFDHTVIESLGYALPPEVWTSEEIERRLAPLYGRLGLPEGRLEHMTGIGERRFWPADLPASEASAQAGRAVLAKSSVRPEEIELLIHGAVCRDRLEPATASTVHSLLGLGPRAQVFDLSNACLGFANALVVAAAMIESGQIERALLVSGENGRPLVERTIRTLLEGDHDRRAIKPYFANLTIGAGAVAAVVCHEKVLAGRAPLARLTAATVETDSSANELCRGDTADDGYDMLTDAEALLEAGMGVANRAWTRFAEETGWNAETPARFVTHQVGRAHQRRLYEELGLDPTKDFCTYPTLGNTGSVALPITLARALEERAAVPGERLAALGIGSGLSALILGFEL